MEIPDFLFNICVYYDWVGKRIQSLWKVYYYYYLFYCISDICTCVCTEACMIYLFDQKEFTNQCWKAELLYIIEYFFHSWGKNNFEVCKCDIYMKNLKNNIYHSSIWIYSPRSFTPRNRQRWRNVGKSGLWQCRGADQDYPV